MEHFESNWNRWAEHGPASYDIEVEVRGPQAATYHVEVRDGEAISATRDDYPLKGPRTIGTWSVVGMFHTMEIDLDQLVLDAAETSKSARLLLDCRFDPEWGRRCTSNGKSFHSPPGMLAEWIGQKKLF